MAGPQRPVDLQRFPTAGNILTITHASQINPRFSRSRADPDSSRTRAR